MLRVESVYKSYKQGERELEVLKDLNFEIKEGEFVVILGPSGSGKTTLLNIIGGLDIPTKGKVYLNEDELSAYNETQLTLLRRDRIGFIFQFFNLMPTLTALENVDFSRDIVRKTGNNYNGQTLLKMVGLYERRNHFPSQLSGGEQQRVAIASSLANDPDIVLCDEPTGELDYRTGRKIIDLLRKLNKKENKTVVIVTHNAVIGKTADRIFHLHNGEVADIETIKKPLDPLKLEW
ncbi:MAG: ABC transporter ATP-binding protein [Candidatus Humimicrobiaceae bacterium]